MEKELIKQQKQITQLELCVADIKQQFKAKDNELKKEKQRVREMEALVQKFKTDLYNSMGLIQEPKKFKKSIRKMYSLYVQDPDVVDTAKIDATIQEEYIRQRQHLEKNVASLKKNLDTSTQVHNVQYSKILKENTSLLREINDMRVKMKELHSKVTESQESIRRKKERQSFTEVKALNTEGAVSANMVPQHKFKEEAEHPVCLPPLRISKGCNPHSGTPFGSKLRACCFSPQQPFMHITGLSRGGRY
ncbi:cilia- and flagella-associated protein 57-like [Scleropages formosus]|uniref:cilia- and flagella-associated protein 57-like n=1 Tax=Scleropages formosus TaxID=113540 RepID=UPI000877EE14|nr:cilia- and flagella-associated protein 57-like [Scleropages formosus]